MKSPWMLPLCLAVALVGFGAAPASAQTFVLTATLTGAGEATQTANGINTGAFGDATITVDMTARTVTYRVNVWNLPSGVTASHIHVGAANTPARSSSASRCPPTRRTTSRSAASCRTPHCAEPGAASGPDDMFQAILGGNSYVNVHSTVNPGGEIRGQLCSNQP